MKYSSIKWLCLFTGIFFCQLSCTRFLEIDPPKDSLVRETVFTNDEVATSAVTGIYSRMAASGYLSGGSSGMSSIGGLLADELVNYSASLPEFYENQLTETNFTLNSSFWSTAYQFIYTANSVLEGLQESKSVTPATKAQLKGEALFIRAFNYFYLVNLFGPVPLHLTSDYRVNQRAFRLPVEQVYQQIEKDLLDAELLLQDSYVTSERVRPNISVVQALLSRMYLYTGRWQDAEKYADKVIAKKTVYELIGFNEVFIKNSKEAIWQLMPAPGGNTLEGAMFILTATPVSVSLSPKFVQTQFEAGDQRRALWVGTFTNATGTYYYPFKYKIKSSATVSEYSMVFRLAELYLIRAEASVHLNKLSDAIDDLDLIRKRASLPLIKTTNPTISKDDLAIAIQKERSTELFAEWGHRWFDLKRTGNATAILSPIKPKWSGTDTRFPIPQAEISRNPNISQNEGY